MCYFRLSINVQAHVFLDICNYYLGTYLTIVTICNYYLGTYLGLIFLPPLFEAILVAFFKAGNGIDRKI